MPRRRGNDNAARYDPSSQGQSLSTPKFDTGKRRTSRNGAIIFNIVIFVVAFAIVIGIAYLCFDRIGIVALVVAVVVGLLVASSMHIVLEWEKAVIMRFGKFNRLAGPGLVFSIPIVEFYTLRVDQRLSTTYFGAEETLTSDLVPINVDAVLYWMVFDPQRATCEVEDYAAAVVWAAQTAMRKAIGRATVAHVAMRRDQLDEELKEAIEAKASSWGVAVIDVEVRDIVVPKELQESISIEAVAEREKNARMMLAEAEKDISNMLADASDAYKDNPDAMRLRTMHLTYESVRQSGGTVVIPSAYSEGFVGPDADKTGSAGKADNS